jgi:GH15 family glucan-1,4-alpha-glucosidase
MYQYGLIGNCQISALIENNGSVDWLCLPRPDSPPVFGRLLDPDGGQFSIETSGKSSGKQNYLSNTNVLQTIVTLAGGEQFEIIDFCPRFYQHGRMYRPTSFFRIIRPIKGSPFISVKCQPVNGWEKELVKPERGNSHLRYEMRNEYLRLATNMPLTYLCEETPFLLKESLYFGLTWDAGIEEDLIGVTERFLSQTIDYWNTWVKHCSIPSLYQKETIRSALTLKLHCYEDTGAILAALTSSLPEEFHQSRNWDYRYCWLRDAYFVLTAFHNLGHFEEMEGFLKFLLNVVGKLEHTHERLHPVYALDQSLPLPEVAYLNWHGFQGSRPVRSNNQAAEHVQNDVYGEMVLTLAPIFFDERFQHLRTREHEDLMKSLGSLCIQNISQPDAGLWEFRNGRQEHSFSNLMCWAGIDRIQKIKELGFLKNVNLDLGEASSKVEAAIRRAVKEGSLRNGPHDESFDASLLQISMLRFPDEALVKETVDRIHAELRLGVDSPSSSFLYRYRRADDFGHPHSSFMICSFWLAQALAQTGQKAKAKIVMENAMSAANSLGLFSEHFLPSERQQIGNFPQAYSHVGQINATFAISRSWGEIL